MKRTLCATCALLMACSSAPPRPPDLGELERACVNDPLNPETWEQLAAALSAEGQRERAATMYLQAATLRTHDVKQDYAVLRQELQSTQEAKGPRTEVRRVGPALVEVLRVDEEREQPPVRLEISNGNGVAGAAKELAHSLDGSGIKTVRLTNTRPFVEASSRIEYPHDQQKVAQALGQRLGMKLSKMKAGLSYADLRIVLGHDGIKKPSGRDRLLDGK